MGRRRSGFGRSLALALFVALAGCGGNVPVARGFGSRQVLALRDGTVFLQYVVDVQGQDATLIYSTYDPATSVGTYWSLDLITGALQELGPNLPSAPSTPPPADGARYTCSTNDLMPDGSKTVEITDTATGATTDISGVTSFPWCVRDDGTFSAFRLDPDTGTQSLWAGPYQNLAPVALPFDVLGVAFYPGSSGNPQPSSVVVLGAPPTQPDAAAIYSIDFASNTATMLVPSTPASAAWAPGAPQAGSLESTSVAQDALVTRYNGHYIYGRKMSDGGTTLFAGTFPSGPASELALFQLAPGGPPPLPPVLRVGPADDVQGPTVVPQIIGWQVDGANGAPSQLIVWDNLAEQVAVCPSVAGAFEYGVASPDGAHALFRARQLGGQVNVAPLQLLSITPGQPYTCVALQYGNVMWADFSGDSSTIAWLVTTDGGLNGQLWTANSDGSNPQMILSGENLVARFVQGTAHLEMAYSGDLVWLDVRDPTRFQYVAEQLFGQATGVGGSWFVAGYNYSAQDASGLLGVVNLDSGAKRSISPAVTQYLVVPRSLPMDAGVVSEQTTAAAYDVAYLVRGRNPSSQDGIWVATVQAADLQ